MDYQVGQQGRVFLCKFDHLEDPLKAIRELAVKEDIRAGVFNLIGAIQKGSIVVGTERNELPPAPVYKKLDQVYEVVGMGTIFWKDNEPAIHLHAAFGKGDSVQVGCLRDEAETFLILEAMIVELKGIEAKRVYDPTSKNYLLKV
jgi:predicted DNA-binding protein with PD1-like motif